MPISRNAKHQESRDQSRQDFIDPEKAKKFEDSFNSSPDFAGAWAKAKSVLGLGSDPAVAGDEEDVIKKQR